MKTSNEMLALIKSWEGCKLEAYLCPANIWTIGYGHTKNVKEGQIITLDLADSLFLEDLEIVENLLNANLKDREVTLGQFDALVSFTYNLGIGNLLKSTLWRKFKNNDPTVTNEFRRWVKAGNKTLPGLVRRREMEIKYWRS